MPLSEITDTIIAQLEQGRVPWVRPWGSASGPPLGQRDLFGNAFAGLRGV